MNGRRSLLFVAVLVLVGQSARARPGDEAFIAAAGAGKGRVLAQARACYDYLGTCTWQAKVLDEASGEVKSVVLDEAENPMDISPFELDRLEERQRFLALGPVSEDLWNRIAAAKASDAIPVVVWLKTYEPSPVREELIGNAALAAAHASRHVQAIQGARAALVSAAAQKGVYKFDFIPDAPAVRLVLTKDQLLWLASLEVVAEVRPWVTPTPLGTTWYETLDVGCPVCNDGTGVKVCIIEPNRPDDTSTLTIVDYYRDPPVGSTNWHARWMAGILRSTASRYGGAASDSSIYVGNYDAAVGSEGALGWCSSSSARVFSYSQASDAALDRVFDYRVRHSPYPFVAAAAGNSGAGTTATNQGFNILCVGGTDDRGTSSRSDDLIYGSTSSANPAVCHYDRELPALAAPAVSITAANVTSSGTSAGAAFVAAAAAQLQAGYTYLASWPEAVRAILMTAADENVDGPVLNLRDETDDRDGAGELNIGLAMTLGRSQNHLSPNNTATQAGFAMGTLDLVNGWTDGWWNNVFRARYALSGMRIRVVLAWDSTASCSDPLDRDTCTSDLLDADLDLYVYAGDQLVAWSTSWDNSYEFVEFDATANQEYTIKVRQGDRNASSTYYGIAWNTWGYGP